MTAIFSGAGEKGGDSAVAPSAGSRCHPGLAPYGPLRDELLRLPPGQWIAHCNRLAASRGLRSAGGMPLRFVAGSDPQGAVGYEAAIFHQGRVACRGSGRGALHDLHNALVWLTFPDVKATLNRLHVESAADADEGSSRHPAPRERRGLTATPAVGRGRGRVRDLATLLDESGLLWLSADASLDARLQARDWLGLLVENRERLTAQVRPIVIGHGLLEKLAVPYKAMTAHCLPCRAVADGAIAAQGGDPRDSHAAACLAAAFAGDRVPKLAPLPILGLPGWDPANVDPSYYDDARVFRA